MEIFIIGVVFLAIALVTLGGVDVQIEYRRPPVFFLKAECPRVHAGTKQHDLGKATLQRFYKGLVKYLGSR